MEVELSNIKKILFVLLLAFAAMVILGFALLFFGGEQPQAEKQPTPVADGREAAIAGVTALFSVDVTDGYDAWLESVCAVSTENGCAFAKLFTNWDRVVEQKVRSECQVQSAELYLDKGDRQVWMVSGTTRNLNTGEEKGGEIPVLVVREEGVWKFDHFLFNEELQAVEADS